MERVNTASRASRHRWRVAVDRFCRQAQLGIALVANVIFLPWKLGTAKRTTSVGLVDPVRSSLGVHVVIYRHHT